MLIAMFYDGKRLMAVTDAYHPEHPSVIVNSIVKETVFHRGFLPQGKLSVFCVSDVGFAVPKELWPIPSSNTLVLYNAQEL